MIHPKIIKKQRFILVALTALILITAILAMGMGYASLSYDRLIPVFLGQGTFKEEFVLFSVRLPRIVITLLAGMALSVSGAILQGITRNDLADPGIVGINSGAGVAIAVFYLFFPIDAGSFVYMLPVIAFIGSFITACIIYLFSYDKTAGLQPIRLLLIGFGFSIALSGAMILLVASSDPMKVDFIAKWLAGNIWGADWPFILAVLPWLAILIPLALLKAQPLNLLQISDPVAVGAGVSLNKERIALLSTAVALAAAAVSVTGGISFIGLMAPHMAKALVGARHQLFVPIAVLMGGWLLLLADTIGRNLAEPDGIAAGTMTAFIGAPYFIYLLLKKS
jgi:iron complex transport system permease protein